MRSSVRIHGLLLQQVEISTFLQVTARELIEQALHFRSKVVIHRVEQARVWLPPRLVTFGAAVIGAVGEVVGMALVVSLAFAFALLIPILI